MRLCILLSKRYEFTLNKLQKLEDALIKHMLTDADMVDMGDRGDMGDIGVRQGVRGVTWVTGLHGWHEGKVKKKT